MDAVLVIEAPHLLKIALLRFETEHAPYSGLRNFADVILGYRAIAHVDFGVADLTDFELHSEIAIDFVNLSVDCPYLLAIEPAVPPIYAQLALVVLRILYLHDSARIPLPLIFSGLGLLRIVVTHYDGHVLVFVLDLAGKVAELDLLAIFLLFEPI